MNDIIAGDPADTNPTARERLIAKTTFGSDRYEADFLAELDAYRAEVQAELLGDELNPSALVLNAASYRLLVERIEATMTNPDQWDGDDAEVEILARYVEWLAARSPMEGGWPVTHQAGESRG